MTWFGWVLIAWWAVSTLALIAMTGQPRKPLTPGAVAFATAVMAALVVGVLVVGTGAGV